MGVERLNFVIAVIGADNFEECLFFVLICDINGLISTGRGDSFQFPWSQAFWSVNPSCSQLDTVLGRWLDVRWRKCDAPAEQARKRSINGTIQHPYILFETVRYHGHFSIGILLHIWACLLRYSPGKDYKGNTLSEVSGSIFILYTPIGAFQPCSVFSRGYLACVTSDNYLGISWAILIAEEDCKLRLVQVVQISHSVQHYPSLSNTP